MEGTSATELPPLNATRSHPQPLKISSQVLALGGLAVAVVVVAIGAILFWFLQCRLRRREDNESERVKQKARDDYENKKGGTPHGKRKVADTRKEPPAKAQTQPSIDSVDAETIAQFESRVRDEFSHERMLEEIREEASPMQRRVETASQRAASLSDLERNDSKVNMFKEAPIEDNDNNNPALGRNVDLATI